MTPILDIIVVNWNAGAALRDCLTSVIDAKHPTFTLGRVVVVDNASSDGSAKNLSDLALPLKIIENRENRGFAAACNQGAASSTADFLLFLNPDTHLFQGTLSKSVAFMNNTQNASFGILGVQMVGDAGTISRSCARFFKVHHFFNRMMGLHVLSPRLFQDGLMVEWDHLQSRAVDHVIGAYFFVRNRVFKQLAGFDERFFVYLEDIDFSLRAKHAGWSTYFLADAQCYHRGGGTSEQIKPRRLYYSLQSRLLYGFKHLGFVWGGVLLFGTLVVEPFSRICQSLICASVVRASDTLKGYWLLWQAIPEILRAARNK